jgi:hypothetical protein
MELVRGTDGEGIGFMNCERLVAWGVEAICFQGNPYLEV